MADISVLNIGGTDYDVKDAEARAGMVVEVIDVTGETVEGVTTATVASLLPNKFYRFTPGLDSLTITALGSGTGLAVYAGKFTSAASAACTLSLPATVTEGANNPTIEAGKTYEFNIADGVLLMVEV